MESPPDRAPLAEVIRWNHQNPWVDCRVITVPYERHVFIRFSCVLPLFQMIAKNVGIRRARGKFILATNIDILFSDELMALLRRRPSARTECIGVTVLMWIRPSRRTFRLMKSCDSPGEI